MIEKRIKLIILASNLQNFFLAHFCPPQYCTPEKIQLRLEKIIFTVG